MPSSSSSAATFTLLSFLAITSTFAQNQASLPDLSKLPQCAQHSATEGIASTSCTLTDFTCICKSQQFLEAVGATISELCSPADQQKTLAFANDVCEPLGVKLPTAEIASSTPSSSAAPGQASAAASPEGASSAAPATETYAAPSAAAARADNEDDMTGGGAAAATSASAAAGMPSVTPPYPIASNGSAANVTNQTALPFEGAASRQRQQPLQLAAVAVTVVLAAAAFSFL